MKRYNHITTLTAVLAAALLLAGCSNESGGNLPQTAGEPAELGVHVEVAPQVRSVVTGEAFSHGSRIGIILHDAAATTTYQGISMDYELRKPSEAAGVWLATETPGLMVKGDLADVLAYSPATLPSGAVLSTDKKNLDIVLPAALDFGDISTSSDFESFYMRLRPTDPDPTEIFVCRDDVDFLTGKGTQVSTSQVSTKESAIAMKHALAMVIVYVKKSPHLVTAPGVKEITIQNSGTNTALVQGSFALTDNVFTPNTIAASYTRTMSGFPVDVVRYAMLVYPATMTAGVVEMELTADETTYTMPMPAKEWKSGWVYVYNVEISANEAQISGVTLTDWPEWNDKPFILD